LRRSRPIERRPGRDLRLTAYAGACTIRGTVLNTNRFGGGRHKKRAGPWGIVVHRVGGRFEVPLQVKVDARTEAANLSPRPNSPTLLITMPVIEAFASDSA